MWDETKADRVFVYQVYCPPTVKQVIASGGSAFVGEVDESTVMKYPLAPGGDMSRLEIEKKLLEIVGPHERIIGLKSFSSDGLYYLERAVNGTLAYYLSNQTTTPTPAADILISRADLFALGCTIYLIMMGHAVFPEIVDEEEGWYDKVREKFEKQQFPQDSHACSAITSKCWLKEYESAEELLRDIEVVEKGLRTGEATQLE